MKNDKCATCVRSKECRLAGVDPVDGTVAGERFEARIGELGDIAVDEGIALVDASGKDLRAFVEAFREPDALFLTDIGHFRGRWLVEGGGTSILFAGSGKMEAIHIRAGTPRDTV